MTGDLNDIITHTSRRPGGAYRHWADVNIGPLPSSAVRIRETRRFITGLGALCVIVGSEYLGLADAPQPVYVDGEPVAHVKSARANAS